MAYDAAGNWIATDLEPTDPAVTTGGQPSQTTGTTTGAPLDTTDDGTDYTGISEVTIPDVGIPAAQSALQGRTTAEIGKGEDRTTSALANQPGYTTPTDASLDTINDAGDYQRPEDTVAFQMDKLMNADSPYMQNATRRAEEQSQKYGALGSSMSVGASTRAAIESALPIAQQDAQTSGKFGLQQQAADNQIGAAQAETELGSSLMVQRMGLEAQQKSLDQAFTLASQGLDSESQLMIADIQGRWSMVTQDANLRLEAALKEKLNNQSIDAEMVASIRGASSDLVQNYQISVEELLKDPDFLQLGGIAIQRTLNNMLATTTASIQFLSDSSGINLDDYLDDFEDNAAFTTAVNLPEETA